jgi:diguanylate cyclase (GGDEF)-like protein/putative nucleotidyltransferase with HDIG domain
VSAMGVRPAGAGTATNRDRPTGGAALSPASAAYLVLVAAVASVLVAPFHLRMAGHTDWLLFALLTACASVVQLRPVETPANQAYSATLVFFVAGALLLPPQLVALMVVIAHLPEWARARYPWYIQTFNIANWVCASLTVYFIGGLFIDHAAPDRDMRQLALGGAAAAAACVFVNHGMLAHMLKLARGKSYRETGLFSFSNLSTELVLASLGVGFAAVWVLAPVLVPFVLAPLVVVYRSLRLPSLEMAARLDPKTELYNARYFSSALESELERARRFDRPLSILLGDLDLLRDVNNTYGHLAGDAVLRGVADVLKSQLRPFDIPCRFGGEEYGVILPEAGHEDALVIAERIRQVVAETAYPFPGGQGAIHATVSFGVATHPDIDSAEDMVHQADLALYRSKALGRNRVSGSAQLATVARQPAPQPAAPRRVEARPEQPARASDAAAHRHVRVVEFVGLLAAAAAALLGVFAMGGVDAIRERPFAFVAFLGLSIGLQLIGTSVYGRGTDAASAIGIIATGFVLGPGAAMVVGFAAAGVQSVRRHGKLYRTIFDIADFGLSGAAAASIFILLHGDSSVAAGFAVAVLAGVAYKAVNVGLLCTAMSLEEGTSFSDIWRERFGWAVLHYLTFGPLAYATALAYERMGLLGLATFAVPPILLAVSMRQYLDRTRASVEEVRRVNDELAGSRQRLHRAYLGTIAALSRSIEAKDEYSGGHVERVRTLSVALARSLGYRREDLEAIEVGALLHDIGKIGVPERILNKPGPLTEVEWEEMKRHPVTSDHILSGIEMHPFVRQIVRSSHERIDGNGYPDGLAGDQIPLPARIVLVADAFDALASDRPYRPGRSIPDVLEELRAHAGTQFCPTVIAALERLWRETPQSLPGADERLRAVC